jgi:hypothetical protein
LKVPPVLTDLYNDLRDRRLLPLVALLVVAIVAVPFLLGGERSKPAAAPPALASPAKASDFTVVQATPGLRDYRKRLRHRSATNPFEQRFSGPVLTGAQLHSESVSTKGGGLSSLTGGSGGESSGGAAPVETPTAPPAHGGGGGDESGGSGPSGHGSGKHPPTPGTQGPAKFYTYTLTVQISHTEEVNDGTTRMGRPVVHEGVKPLTPLPGEKAPVVTYVGANIQTGKGLFVVSKDVTAVFGDAKCVSGTDSCELLELEPGFPETFEYGPNHVRYKFKVVAIDVVPEGNS